MMNSFILHLQGPSEVGEISFSAKSSHFKEKFPFIHNAFLFYSRYQINKYCIVLPKTKKQCHNSDTYCEIKNVNELDEPGRTREVNPSDLNVLSSNLVSRVFLCRTLIKLVFGFFLDL